MLLTLKNKTLMGMNRLIEDVQKQKYAIINELELNPAELFMLIREIEVLENPDERIEIKRDFKVSSEDNSANIFKFFGLDRDFVDKWNKRVYTVTYRGVQLGLYHNVRKPL